MAGGEGRGTVPRPSTGILSSLVAPLGRKSICVFAVSTYDTDYLLVKRQQLARAMTILSRRFTIGPKARTRSTAVANSSSPEKETSAVRAALKGLP